MLTGKHNRVTLSFLLVSHTKFAPDWSFGLLKQSSLENLAAVVEASAKHNRAQLPGKEDGFAVIPVYDGTASIKLHQ